MNPFWEYFGIVVKQINDTQIYINIDLGFSIWSLQLFDIDVENKYLPGDHVRLFVEKTASRRTSEEDRYKAGIYDKRSDR